MSWEQAIALPLWGGHSPDLKIHAKNNTQSFIRAKLGQRIQGIFALKR
jgi:hypothetical protein